MTVNILGEKYTIERRSRVEEPALEAMDGYCDDSIKLIVVNSDTERTDTSKYDIPYVRRKQIRHEIVHGFLFESGLAENSDWAQNEEMVDWIAMQGPKIYKVWQEADAL